MTITFKVRGYRGAERADVVAAPIALLAGLNGVGKSSICQAVAAALGSQPIPFFRPGRPDKPALTKTQAKSLLRGGMDKGWVELEVEGKPVARVEWPSMTVHGTGKVSSSMIATGLLNPMEYEDTARQQFFAELLGAAPTDTDVHAALDDVGVPKDPVAEGDQPAPTSGFRRGLLADIATNGWDVVHKRFREDGARMKGRWEGITGSKYGSQKADAWSPDGWRDELEEATEELLATAASNAQKSTEAAIAAAAVDAAAIADLKEAARLETKAEDDVAAARAAYEKADAAVKPAQNAVTAIVVPTGIPCPHCSGVVDVVQELIGPMKLVPSTATQEQIAEAVNRKQAAQGVYDKAIAARTEAEKKLTEARAAYEARKGSGKRLAEAETKKGSREAVDLARDLQRGHEADLARWKARAQASALHGRIVGNQIIVDLLSPEGLRRQKLARALASFNRDVLAPLCAAGKYSTITVSDDLDVLYGGRPYYLLSESEKYRVKLVLQIAVAKKDKSAVVVLDGADILDLPGRQGMLTIISDVAQDDGIAFLVGMTVTKKEQVPDLAKFDMGNTYWIENGIAGAL